MQKLILTKQHLELPAEESGIITLKAEEGDAVAVGAVVCLIDTSAEKPADFVSQMLTDASEAEAAKKEEAKPELQIQFQS